MVFIFAQSLLARFG